MKNKYNILILIIIIFSSYVYGEWVRPLNTNLNNTINISSNQFNCSSGYALQNISINSTGILGGSCIAVSSSGSSDGTGGWTNTSTTTSTALNVSISVNSTFKTQIGYLYFCGNQTNQFITNNGSVCP